MTDTTECQLSGMPRAWCAHCRGNTSGPAVDFAPTRHAPHVRPLHVPLAHLAPPGARQPRPRGFPALCSLGPDCRPRDPDHPRETGGRAWVCPPCEDRARDALAGLVAVWPDLLNAITALPPVVTGETRGPKGDPATGLRLNEYASGVRSDVERHAAWYGQAARASIGDPPSTDTPALLSWLARSAVPYLTAHPNRDVAECFARDSAALLNSARRAAYPNPAKTVTIPDTVCQARHEDGTPGVCGGTLTATIRADATSLPDLVCATDPNHRIPPSVWRRHDWATRHLT